MLKRTLIIIAVIASVTAPASAGTAWVNTFLRSLPKISDLKHIDGPAGFTCFQYKNKYRYCGNWNTLR
ncbi:MAG: hypothetical protein U1E15_06185 [Hyphomicrobiales bacterium]